MRIIEIAALDNGAHNNQEINNAAPSGFPVPDGWAVIHESMAIPDTFPFVSIEVAEIEGIMTVTSMTAGVVPDPEPEADPEPSDTDVLNALLGV